VEDWALLVEDRGLPVEDWGGLLVLLGVHALLVED
jgi:hypothetical protein